MLTAQGFDKRRRFDLTWVRYRRITRWADPPRAKVIVASARAVVFSVTMRNASDWARSACKKLHHPQMHNLLRLDTKHCRVAGDLHPVREQHVPSLIICRGRTISASIVRSTQRQRCANQAHPQVGRRRSPEPRPAVQVEAIGASLPKVRISAV